MANAGTVTVDFAAEVAKFNAQLKTVQSSVRGVEQRFVALEAVGKTALKFFSVGVSARFIQSAADAADETGKLADKLRISTERLTAFQLAAADAGVEQGTLNKLLSDSQKRLGEAAGGTGKAFEFIQKLKLDVTELQRLSPDQLFLTYADAIGTLSNRSEQFAAANALFGKSAQEAWALIDEGRPAIEAAIGTVDRLGLALNRVDIKKIEEANDKISLLGRVSQAFGQQLAAALAPFVSEFVDRLTESGAAADETRGKLDAFARGVFIAFEIIANAARVFDITVSGAFAGFFIAVEKVASAGAKMRQVQSDALRAAGLDTLADDFQNAANRFTQVEQFAAAASEQASARVKAALDNIRSFEQISAEADRIVAEAQARAAAAVQESQDRAGAGTETLGGDPGTDHAIQAYVAALEVRAQFLEENDKRIAESNREMLRKMDLDLTEYFGRTIEQHIEAERAILEVKQGAQNAALGLLQAFASKSKTAAIALIAINKARAIAQAIQNTHVAATLQLTSGDPYTAVARAAAVKLWGYAQVAAIAATGFMEAKSVASSPGSGAPLGSPANPIFTDTGGNDERTFGASQRSQISITVEGVITPGAARALAEAIKDVVDNGDVHIIGSDSSQARELRGG